MKKLDRIDSTVELSPIPIRKKCLHCLEPRKILNIVNHL